MCQSRKEKELFFILLLFFEYFLFTLLFYFIGKNIGTDGVYVQLFGGGNDSTLYWRQLTTLFDNPYASSSLEFTSGYVPFIFPIFKAINIPDVFVIRFINYTAFIFLVIVCLKILNVILFEDYKEINRNCSNIKLSCVTNFLLLLSLYPSLIFILTTGIYRDIWIYLFFMSTILFYLKFISGNKINCIPLILSIILLNIFRPYAAFGACLGIGIHQLLKMDSGRQLKFKMILFFFLTFVFFTFFKNFEFSFLNNMSFDDVLNYREGEIGKIQTGGSDFNIKLDSGNYFIFIIKYAYCMLVNFVGPLPWQVKSVSLFITFILESVIVIYMLYTIIKVRKRIKYKSVNESALLCICLAYLMLFSLSNKNIGTATRLRVPIFLVVGLIYQKYKLRGTGK